MYFKYVNDIDVYRQQGNIVIYNDCYMPKRLFYKIVVKLSCAYILPQNLGVCHHDDKWVSNTAFWINTYM